MNVKYVSCSLHLLKTNCCSVSFRDFTDLHKRKADGMAFVVSDDIHEQEWSYQGKF